MATAKCGYWEVRENANSSSFLVKLKIFNYICYEKSFICILIQCFKILILSIIFCEDLNWLMKTDFVYLFDNQKLFDNGFFRYFFEKNCWLFFFFTKCNEFCLILRWQGSILKDAFSVCKYSGRQDYCFH